MKNVNMIKIIIRRSLGGFKFSFQGLLAAWRLEEAIRVEFCLLLPTIIASIYLSSSKIECALMISSGLLVILVELINTAIEKTINRISTNLHPLSKVVKDISSAAVFIAIVNFIFIWLVVLI
jgi:diacylglycerol kinase (ATP)